MPIEDCAADSTASLIGLEMSTAAVLDSVAATAALAALAALSISTAALLAARSISTGEISFDSVTATATLAVLEVLDACNARAVLAALGALDASTAEAVLKKHNELAPDPSSAHDRHTMFVALIARHQAAQVEKGAPVLLPVAPIAEDYVDPFQVTPATVPSVANPSCHAASNSYTKPLRSRELTMMMRFWMESRQTPYATLEEKHHIAQALNIPVAQVTNFCNNYRKRYLKVGQKLTSYRVHAAAAQCLH
jgi:hypothetical protein